MLVVAVALTVFSFRSVLLLYIKPKCLAYASRRFGSELGAQRLNARILHLILRPKTRGIPEAMLLGSLCRCDPTKTPKFGCGTWSSRNMQPCDPWSW